MTAGGKGHIQRPRSVIDEEYASRWDAIFQRDIPSNHSAQDLEMVSRNLTEGVMSTCKQDLQVPTNKESLTVPRSLIEGIMSTETCAHPFCECKDVCKEAK